jgi:hypothetical protein
MRTEMKRIGPVLLLASALFGCGGSIKGKGAPDGSTTGACATLGACECMAASDRCSAQVEACWCPSECDPNIACICGGGRFLGCADKAVVASCTNELAAVEAKCTGQPGFVQYLGDICSSSNPSCVAGCLANLKNTGSCTEIDCNFCPVCDCAGTTTPFVACLSACNPPLPD